MANLIPIPFAIFGLPAGSELILILVMILILFGGKKIPELMRGMGKGVGELQKGLHEGKRSMEEAMKEEAEKAEVDEATNPKPASKTVAKD